MILHNLTKSPYSLSDQHGIFRRVTANDSIILTQDATYCLQLPEILKQFVSSVATVYVLIEDVNARGLSLSTDKVEPINYSGWVEACLKHTNMITW